MTDHDEDVPISAEDIEREQWRQATLRTFEVELHNGKVARVFAHFWHDDNPAGHLHFVTVQPSGRKLIHDLFSATGFVKVNEVTPAKTLRTIDKIADLEYARERGRQVLENLKRPDRRTH